MSVQPLLIYHVELQLILPFRTKLCWAPNYSNWIGLLGISTYRRPCLTESSILVSACAAKRRHKTSENTTTKLNVKPIQIKSELKLLRPLAGYTLYDHKTNDYIRRELRITGILGKIDEYRRNWLSHLQRMPQNRIPLKSYHHRPQGRRTIGRPKKRWREQL